MGFLERLFNARVQNALMQYESKNKKKSNTISAKTKDFFVKTSGLVNVFNYGRDIIQPPEYDFEEIRAAAETDSYVKIALDKHKRLVYKAGYYYKSENEKAVEYIKTRFRIMSYATKVPMDVLFQEIADDLITYSNCMLVKTRVDQVMPGIKAVGVLSDKPVGGYSRIDISTVSIKRDKYGNVQQYIQRTVNGDEKKYNPSDVIHIYMNKDASNSVGTPNIIAALEDVKLLRKLEGNVLAIIHRFAMPIFHWKIGKPQAGFQATDKEIDEAKREIESSSIDGNIITNEKTEITVVGAGGGVINAAPYLAYFESRVISALDSSSSQFGRGGAKQDADSMEGQSHDYIKYIQKVLSIFIENYMLNELLLEGGFNPILNEKDIVSYIFNEINIETKIKLENHEMLKFQSNLQTRDEARRNIGLKEEVDESKMYINLVTTPSQIEVATATAKVQADSQIKINKASASLETKAESSSSSSSKSSSSSSKTKNSSSSNGTGKSGTLSNGKKSSNSANKDVKSRNMPQNQHGTTSVKVKEALEIKEMVIRDKEKHEGHYKDFYNVLENMKYDISSNEIIEDLYDGSVDLLYEMYEATMLTDIVDSMNNAVESAKAKAIKDLEVIGRETSFINSLNIDIQKLVNTAQESVNGILYDIRERIDGDNDFSNVESVIDSYKYRFRFVMEHVIPKTYWYAYIAAGASAGIEKAEVIFGDSKDKEKYPSIINTKDVELDNIPAFHPFCDCGVKYIN